MKNYEVEVNDRSFNPPETFDSYAEAANWMMRQYNDYRSRGYVLTPIINGQFTYYFDGEDDEQGNTLAIVISCNT